MSRMVDLARFEHDRTRAASGCSARPPVGPPARVYESSMVPGATTSGPCRRGWPTTPAAHSDIRHECAARLVLEPAARFAHTARRFAPAPAVSRETSWLGLGCAPLTQSQRSVRRRPHPGVDPRSWRSGPALDDRLSFGPLIRGDARHRRPDQDRALSTPWRIQTMTHSTAETVTIGMGKRVWRY